jgi:serine phosphatase RsbU (regulator of sigma subunit)
MMKMPQFVADHDQEQVTAEQEPLARVAADLLVEIEPVSSLVENRDVYKIFEVEPELIGLPVVDDGRATGLINRNRFMQCLARPFHRELYWNKSCTAFMDTNPLIADAAMSVGDLSLCIAGKAGSTLLDSFVVVEDGRYRGMGLTQGVLRAVARLQAEKNRMVMDSIAYGSVIQNSLGRSSRLEMRKVLADHFLLWEPRDVVSGDFYYFREFDDGFLFGLYDCTGHGVPGAFMTLIMSSFLQGAINSESCRDPGRLLGEINRQVKRAMGQIDHQHSEGTEHRSDDGMDAAFCWYDRLSGKLTYAGAHIQMYLLSPQAKEINIVAGDRHGVGYASTAMDASWSNHEVLLDQGTAVYLFTDGVLDQLGGEKRIAFGRRRLCATLLQHRDQAMPEQRVALLDALARYQGDEVRRDDVSAFGFRAP